MHERIRAAVRPGFSLGVAALGIGMVAAVAGGTAAPAPLLPDLVQRAPDNLQAVESRPGKYELVFGSRVENLGAGPLAVHASRPDTSTPRMTAEQVVTHDDGSSTRIPNVGVVRYVTSPDHAHWHYLRFDRYSLRRLEGGRVRRDRKTGFCLGDRYEVEPPLARLPRRGDDWDEDCGRDEPDLRAVNQGISPGWGDPYAPQLEGQSIRLRTTMKGRYRLIHHVNSKRGLLESDYANNVAAATVRISWPDGRDDEPFAEIVESCEGRTRC